MAILSAATVSDRSPPPSCSRMIEPVSVFLRILLTILLTPGRAQSRGSTDQSSAISFSLAQYSSVVRDQAPWGARKMVGTRPHAV
jgi:hypothetical protein